MSGIFAHSLLYKLHNFAQNASVISIYANSTTFVLITTLNVFVL